MCAIAYHNYDGNDYGSVVVISIHHTHIVDIEVWLARILMMHRLKIRMLVIRYTFTYMYMSEVSRA